MVDKNNCILVPIYRSLSITASCSRILECTAEYVFLGDDNYLTSKYPITGFYLGSLNRPRNQNQFQLYYN